MFYSCTHMATVGFKGLSHLLLLIITSHFTLAFVPYALTVADVEMIFVVIVY